MNKTLASAQAFVDRHKVAIIVGTVGLTAILLQQRAIKQHNDYLKEHGLYEEYYALEEL